MRATLLVIVLVAVSCKSPARKNRPAPRNPKVSTTQDSDTQTELLEKSGVAPTVGKKLDTPVVEPIRSNYFDLPKNKTKEVKTLLKSPDIAAIKRDGLQVLIDYFKEGITKANDEYETDVPIYLSLPNAYFRQIYARLPAFAGTPKLDQFAEDEQTPTLAAYLLYRLDRSPETLTALYNVFALAPFRYVSKRAYIKHNMHHTVNGLIGMHERFSKHSEFDEFLTRYYDLLFKGGQSSERNTSCSPWSIARIENEPRFYELLEKLSPELDDMFENEEDEWQLGLEDGVIWGLSFWARRHHEKNRKAVLEILRNVQKLYRSAVTRDATIRNYEKTLFDKIHVESPQSTSDYKITPYGFGKDGIFYFCDWYSSSNKEGEGYVELISLSPENKQTILVAHNGDIVNKYPLLDLMLETQVDWIKKLDAEKVDRMETTLIPFPLKQDKKYDITLEAPEGTSDVTLWLHTSATKTRKLAVLKFGGPSICEKRARCISIAGYYSSPKSKRIVVLVSQYIGWENFRYQLLSVGLTKNRAR